MRGNVHRNAVIVSDSPRILGVLAASGRRDIPLRYALWTEDAAGFAVFMFNGFKTG